MDLGLIIQRRSHFPLRGGRNESEWPAGMDRNGWPECVGIRTRIDIDSNHILMQNLIVLFRSWFI